MKIFVQWNVSKKRSHLFSAQARGNKAGWCISSHNGLQLQSLKDEMASDVTHNGDTCQVCMLCIAVLEVLKIPTSKFY